MFPEALLVDLADPVSLQELSGRPERLLERIQDSPNRQILAIRDIQSSPALWQVARNAVEQRLISGCIASATSLKELEEESDLTSTEVRIMHPLMAGEMGDPFRLEAALAFGMLPAVSVAPNPADEIKKSAAFILREVIRSGRIGRDSGSFVRFLEAATFAHAGVLNLAAVARECGISRSIAAGYLKILEESLLAWRLPVFSQGTRRGLSVHPQFFLFDTGFFRAVRPAEAPSGRVEDAAFKGLVAQHLRAWCGYSAGNHTLYHWMTRSGLGVDFVVQGDSGLFALDVVNVASVRSADLRGLRAFGKDHPQSRRVLLHRGPERFERDGVSCLPCEDFLQGLTPD